MLTSCGCSAYKTQRLQTQSANTLKMGAAEQLAQETRWLSGRSPHLELVCQGGSTLPAVEGRIGISPASAARAQHFLRIDEQQLRVWRPRRGTHRMLWLRAVASGRTTPLCRGTRGGWRTVGAGRPERRDGDERGGAHLRRRRRRPKGKRRTSLLLAWWAEWATRIGLLYDFGEAAAVGSSADGYPSPTVLCSRRGRS